MGLWSSDSSWFIVFLEKPCGVIPKLVSKYLLVHWSLLCLGPGLMAQTEAIEPKEERGQRDENVSSAATCAQVGSYQAIA